MKSFITISTIFISFISAVSQENSIYLNDYLMPFITNPACAGSEYYPVASLSVKKQWVGFSEAPTTYTLSGHFRIGTHDFYNPKGLVNKGPLNLKDRIGLGGMIFQDKDGPLENTGGILSYAYHLPIDRKSRISLGLSTIFMNHQISTSILDPINKNDPYLLAEDNNGFQFNVGAGMFYYNNTYFVGLSANKILPGISNVNEESRNVTSYFFMGGYKFFKKNNSINFQPSFALKRFDDEPVVFEMHSKFYIKRLNWIALSYSSVQLINIQFALRLYKKLYAGYNYGFTMGEISDYNNGSHQFSLGINLGLVGVEGLRDLVNYR